MNDLDPALPGPTQAALETSPASEPLFDAPAEVMAQPSVPELAIPEPPTELTEPREGVWVRMGREVMTGLQTLVSAAGYATLIVTFGVQVARLDGLGMAPA